MNSELTGGCLCGLVKFSLKNRFKTFYQCHCKQCQQLTGSAFASNIFTDKENIKWLTGKDKVIRYEHPSRSFSKSFCSKCGSALPFINKSKTSLIIPAGSLDQEPNITPQANIFTSEQACWLKSGLQAESHRGFPK